jgi:hypothetical protein
MEFIHAENKLNLSSLLITVMATSAFIKLTDASITIDRLLSAYTLTSK